MKVYTVEVRDPKGRVIRRSETLQELVELCGRNDPERARTTAWGSLP